MGVGYDGQAAALYLSARHVGLPPVRQSESSLPILLTRRSRSVGGLHLLRLTNEHPLPIYLLPPPFGSQQTPCSARSPSPVRWDQRSIPPRGWRWTVLSGPEALTPPSVACVAALRSPPATPAPLPLLAPPSLPAPHHEFGESPQP